MQGVMFHLEKGQDFEKAVAAAIQRSEERLGVRPTVCLVHTLAPVRVLRFSIKVLRKPYILPGDFLLAVEE